MTTHTDLAAQSLEWAEHLERMNLGSIDRLIAKHLRACAAALSTERLAGGGEPAWENSEGWESLAWELCADEHGEDSCNELIWEGGPVPEPWGERWLKYEDEAKRLIALVHKHVPAAPPPQAERVPLSDEQVKDAARWRQVREHWKNARFTFRKTPENTVKTITLLIDFDHATTCGANELEREFDEARAHGITPKEGT